ncbi:cardiolipin synthase [Pontiellaceae bacterium B12219]|nr:cardiolipin synthase [Pontiellaceae bacterium B12219]
MIIWSAIILLFHVMGVISAIVAIMTARTSQGSIAWAISLVMCPYVAVPAYWILGRSRFAGYVNLRTTTEDTVHEKLDELVASLEAYRLPISDLSHAAMAAEHLADLPITSGNDVKLLIDGDATFDDIVRGIDAAKDYILFQFFIVKDDGLGRRVKTHLLKKCAEGVRVYFLYDEVGSNKLPKSYVQELQAAGCEIHPFNTRKGRGNRFQLNFRNHRKIVVVDGQVSWIGGHNVGDEYLGLDPKFGHWRDTHTRITGPAALAAQLSFSEDWYWATDQRLSPLNWAPVAAASGNRQVLVVPSGPADELETASLMFLHAINFAKKRIWISSPYFVPDDAIISALQLAGLRGVDVRILIPDMPDHLAVYLAAYSYFDDAGKTGVRFYRYSDGFLHEKSMLIDDHLATVGTANFDNRSFRLNFEITGVVLDEDFAKEIEQMFLADFEKAREMEVGEYGRKSFWFRLAVRFARLTSPIQ